jgi:hypothetical protein
VFVSVEVKDSHCTKASQSCHGLKLEMYDLSFLLAASRKLPQVMIFVWYLSIFTVQRVDFSGYVCTLSMNDDEELKIFY